MDQVNEIQKYIGKLKQQILNEQQLKKEYQLKFESENLQRLKLEERLEESDKKISIKSQYIETLEIKIDELEQKVKCIQDVKDKKSGFFGKMFNGGVMEQQALHIKQIESQLSIQLEETEKLHAQVYSLKTQLEAQSQKQEESEKLYEQKIMKAIATLKQEKSKLLNEQKRGEELQKEIEGLKEQIIIIRESCNGLEFENDALNIKIRKELSLQHELEESLKKLNQQLIESKQQFMNLVKDNEQLDALINRIRLYLNSLRNESESDLGRSTIINQILNILERENEPLIHKELLLDSKIGQYELFIKAQEKILKLGKRNEQLIKQNKQLNDKLIVIKNKQ